MRKFQITGVVAIALIAGQLSHAEKLSSTDKKVLATHFKLCKQQADINNETTIKINQLLASLNLYSSAMEALQKGDAAKIKYQMGNIERNRKYALRQLKNSEKRYLSEKKKLDSIKHDKKIEEKLAELEAKKQAIQAKLNKLKKPFEDRIKSVMSNININAKNSELKNLLSKYILTGAKDSKLVTRKSSSARFEDGFFSCHWYNGNKSIAWAHFRLRPVPANLRSKTLIADKYKVTSLSNNSVWLWVKNMHICVVVDAIQYQGKEKIPGLVEILMDLAGLEKSCDNTIVKQSVTTYQFIDQIRKDSRKATSKLTRERYAVNRKISGFKKQGYYSTEEMAKLSQSLFYAKDYYERNKSTIKTGDILIKLLKAPPAQREKAISQLAEMIKKVKDEIDSVCEKADAVKAQFTKSINFPAANSRYQNAVSKFIRIPGNKKFVLINRRYCSAWLGIPQVNCKWSFDTSTSRSSAVQYIFTGIITYKPGYKQSSQTMLNDKYPVYHHSKYSISLKAGDFVINLNSSNSQIYDKEFLETAVTELLDLEAIADASK